MNLTKTEQLRIPVLFDPVIDALPDALCVAWDGCHKIYLALDEDESEWFQASYPHVVEGTAEEMLVALINWWDSSCSLRFIEGVRRNEADPNAGFVTLIGQFADEDGMWDESEDDE